MNILTRAIPAAFVVFGQLAFSQTVPAPESPCPMHASHLGADAHRAMVESHGDQAMGFPHDKTTHHFRLEEDGGAIEVTANDPKDSANIDAIRMHLAHIAELFTHGDFSTPMFVHDSIPPGVTTMKLMKEKIHFAYREVGAGGRVSLSSEDAVARAAIHDFLRFQITDHRTGDAMELAGTR
ncbi:MAG TPA: hypothetical protein VN753_15935 [Terracidiphilus sp.]|nr:hypothetical protein [Terracidiphilus sp.]